MARWVEKAGAVCFVSEAKSAPLPAWVLTILLCYLYCQLVLLCRKTSSAMPEADQEGRNQRTRLRKLLSWEFQGRCRRSLAWASPSGRKGTRGLSRGRMLLERSRFSSLPRGQRLSQNRGRAMAQLSSSPQRWPCASGLEPVRHGVR